MGQQLQSLLEKMWIDYVAINPQAQKIHDLFAHNGETVVNDHVALRTFNHPKLGIESLAAPFKKLGYVEKGEYTFTEKKLYAKHYENIDPQRPKVFISELELEKVSPFIQETIDQCVQNIGEKTTGAEDFPYSGRHWISHHSTYLKLAAESEYASWVYAYGFRPNHFTVSLNHLRGFNEISRLNDFIRSRGFRLNASGGLVKGTPADYLEQSSTMASEVNLQFADGIYATPGCYYEFAKRYPMMDGKLYQGFVAKSADKIFESTNKL